jgi:hypothetical protein
MDVEFNVSGQAWSVIEGSEIVLDAVRYDGGSQGAQDALRDLNAAEWQKVGHGKSLLVRTTVEGARCIERYCRTVGETFAYESEADTKSDDRALLIVADRIVSKLA